MNNEILVKRVEHPTSPESEILFKKPKPHTDKSIQQVHQKQLIVSSYDDLIKNPIPENPTTITLNTSDYRKWNVNQVASVLIADDSDGGCSLLVDDVFPLVDAKFKGSSLHNIIRDLNRDEDYAVKELERIYNKHDNPQLSSTFKSIIFWVKDNLCTPNIPVLYKITLSQNRITEVNYTPDNYEVTDREMK